MISSNELNYVSYKAHTVPYPGINYAREALEELRMALQLFNDNYNRVKYNVCFSNSSELKLEILEKNVAHMLGIDHTGLVSSYHAPFRKDVLGLSENASVRSFELLSEIVKNADTLLDYEKSKNTRILNYYTIRVKCAIFEKIANLSNFNYGCINFDKSEYTKHSDKPFLANSEKLLFVESGEVIAPYFMMGFVKSNDYYSNYNNGSAEDCRNENTTNTPLVVETLFAPINPKSFFDNQEVCIPTHLLFDKKDIFTKAEATPEEKIRLIKMYHEITTTYQLPNRLNTLGDYMLMLHNQQNEQNHVKLKARTHIA